MNLLSQIIIFNLLFLETLAFNLSVSQSTPKITETYQTISQFNSTFLFNTTIQIEGEQFEYLIVQFQQTSKDKSKMAVLYNEKFPTLETNKTLQFKDMDYDSFALKKKNHYLFIENQFIPKFITILSNISITFDLILTGTNTSKCLNNCNNYGNCIRGRCVCISNYIGKDCSIKATELEIQTWRNQTLSNNVTFFYYQQQEKSKELDLIFYTDSQENISVFEIVSSVISLPTPRFYDFYGKFNKSTPLAQIISSKGFKDLDQDDFLSEDTDQDDKNLLNGTWTMQISLPSRMIIAVLCNTPNASLSISFQQRSKYGNTKNLLEWLLPVIIVGVIIILGLFFIIRRNIKKGELIGNQVTQVQLVTDCDICYLCQQSLKSKNDEIVVKINSCQQEHNFHEKCLLQFYSKKSRQLYCPNCPQILSEQQQ
ncbi:unnamed protein product (macronuclear) [Paramecium tetraurelia]|uniref:RING-type domain-containing protein n=1 Tax=Paramecium tetraurelia TaxID=5888 RepID=A0CC16_PARTE|nr:uncharacterized protein GSPATT00037117001 [Paramecium tetraurelia]CAK68333.1 unnamed protein product [Paramecium tetraurelia]|eukprot:XP_001435730.1 hypothetical protein (macronuclear) [Paramecium tetraurelia strain d4-2]